MRTVIIRQSENDWFAAKIVTQEHGLTRFIPKRQIGRDILVQTLIKADLPQPVGLMLRHMMCPHWQRNAEPQEQREKAHEAAVWHGRHRRSSGGAPRSPG